MNYIIIFSIEVVFVLEILQRSRCYVGLANLLCM